MCDSSVAFSVLLLHHHEIICHDVVMVSSAVLC